MLNKSDLLNALQKEFNIPKRTIKSIVNFIIVYIGEKLRSGVSFQLKGLFSARQLVTNRSYTNPRTGALIPAKERKIVKFKASKSLNS